MPNLALIVLGLIIFINIVTVVLILWVGSKHDEHREVREPQSSKALSRIYEAYNFPATMPRGQLKTEELAEELSEAVEQLQDEVPTTDQNE